MTGLLKAGKLDLHPVITDRIARKDFAKGMERLKTGEASKPSRRRRFAKRNIPACLKVTHVGGTRHVSKLRQTEHFADRPDFKDAIQLRQPDDPVDVVNYIH
jgi:hypothetical protein